jgi:hypothetical protein
LSTGSAAHETNKKTLQIMLIVDTQLAAVVNVLNESG